MKETFNYKNDMAVPKIEKVTINTGFGRLLSGKTGDEHKKTLEQILNDLTIICGQSAVKTFAKKSIAGFKVRQGMPLGAKVTLRGKKMTDFLERLINVVLPRTRDFRGIDKKSVDKSGNLTIAIREHIAFPEISPEKARNIFGLEVVITTTTDDKEKGSELLRLLGIPIKQ